MDTALSARMAGSFPTSQTAVDVVLISMPFGPLWQPSIGLSLLKGALAPLDVSTRILYFTLPFADQIGVPLYSQIAAGQPDTTDLVGEWIFAPGLAEVSESDTERYIEQVLFRKGSAYQNLFINREHIADDFIHAIVKARSEIEPFLDACVESALMHHPKIIGFTSVFQQQLPSLALAKRLKLCDPQLAIIFGGANCEGPMGAQLARSFPFIDGVVSGEGEVVFPKMVEKILQGETVADLQGVFTTENTRVPTANRHYLNAPSIRDLDLLPYPNFDDFYEQWKAASLQTIHPPKLLFETSRGCWWGEKHHCTFCGLNGSAMAFRSKSAQRAIHELEYLITRYPDSPVAVVDNILDMKYFKDFIPNLARRDLGLELFYEVKANLRKEQIQQLRDAGITQIQPGIESLSSSVLELMSKGVKGLQNIQLLKWCEELGVRPHWNIIWGFPGEPPEEYARMARMIPLLHHLRPPVVAATIRLDRFSPNFDQSDEHGFMDVTPYPAYRFVYPPDVDNVSNLAYFFSYRYRELQNVASYVQPLAAQVAQWQSAYQTSELFFLDKGTHLLIRDRRHVAQKPLTILSGLARRLYLACDGIRTLDQLHQIAGVEATHVHQQTQELRGTSANGQIAPDEIESSLQGLVDLGLMISEGKHYLSLAIPQSHVSPDEQRAQDIPARAVVATS